MMTRILIALLALPALVAHSEPIKVKGLYLGQDANEAVSVMEDHLREAGRSNVKIRKAGSLDMGIVNISGSIEHGNHIETVFTLIANGDNQLTSIDISGSLVDDLFNTHAISVSRFADLFKEAYGIELTPRNKHEDSMKKVYGESWSHPDISYDPQIAKSDLYYKYLNLAAGIDITLGYDKRLRMLEMKGMEKKTRGFKFD